jgi:hypothetical protein
MRSDEPGIESHPHRGEGEHVFQLPSRGLRGADGMAS